MTACAYPGCTGTVQDGYCDTCGNAPMQQPAGRPGNSSVPSAPSAWQFPPGQPQGGSAPGGYPGYGPSGPHGGYPQAYPSHPSAAGSGQPAVGQQPNASPSAPSSPAGQPSAGPPSAGQPSAWRAAPSAPVSGWRAAPSAPVAGWRTSPTSPDPGTSPTSGRSTSSTRSRRNMLGAGLVHVPPVPYRDPAEVVLVNPEVPEEKRFCSNPECGKPVGRSRDGRPGRTEGFCPYDGTRFSFTPKLQPGDLVAGQYEVKGCLAHGGLGWIYLAADLNLDGRWVVLKGLLDTGDTEAMLAAEAERRFLTGVDHPNIVRIFNFVQHPDPTTMQMVGYIVMEYVGGQSLQEMLRARLRASGNREALPVAQAIAYTLEVLRAFEYLHDRNLLYCDLKPANVIQVEDQLKLIDLGAVRHADDQESAIYGTVGYQAPEIATEGPSISSDLYTVGRMLAVLSFPFSPVTGGKPNPLPPPEQIPPQARHESFLRFLHRATDPDPRRRFSSAGEMAEQLTGVLREIRAAEDGIPYPAASGQFGPERVAAGTALASAESALFNGASHGQASGAAAGGPDPEGRTLVALDPQAAIAALPTPLVDPADPAAGFLAGITARTLDDLVNMIRAAPEQTIETRLALIRALIEQGNPEVGEELDKAAREAGADWRVLWYHGLRDLAWGNVDGAGRAFDELYYRMPGEIAPRLALAFSRELAGDPRDAGRHYAAIWRTDHSYISAAFGLARACLAEEDRAGATRVLDEVPPTSSHWVVAQTANVAIAVRGRPPGTIDTGDLVTAGERLNAVELDAVSRDRLAAEVLEAALAWLNAGGRAPAGTVLLDHPLTEREVRKELERVYRRLARATTVRADRHAFVDRANGVRPRTWI